MTFYSPSFIFVFLPCFVLLYNVCGKKLRDIVLFGGSMLFYFLASGKDYLSVAILIAAVAFNYMAGILVGVSKGKTKKLVFGLCTAVNAVALLSPKIISIVTDSFAQSLPEGLAIVAPIGFSFYMFKNMSYLRQIYDCKTNPELSFISLGAYLTLFSQVLSGPIQTYADFKKSRDEGAVGIVGINSGLYEFIIGLSLKILLADRIIRVWTAGLYGINSIGVNSISTPLAWLGFIAYPLYLYFEFYGYSLMSRGIGRMIGFETPDNFLHPYISRSVSEFWRRWHITLGEWFKENVYFPLGGNRCPKGRTILNLCAVWFCTGVWHALCFDGNGINFILWAAFLLLFILLEKLGALDWIIKNKVLSHIYLLVVILFSWAIFNTSILTLADLGTYFTRLFPFFSGTPEYVDPSDWVRHFKDVGVYMAVGVIFLTPLPRRVYDKFKNIKPLAVAVMLVLFWLSVYLIFCEGANPMVY